MYFVIPRLCPDSCGFTCVLVPNITLACCSQQAGQTPQAAALSGQGCFANGHEAQGTLLCVYMCVDNSIFLFCSVVFSRGFLAGCCPHRTMPGVRVKVCAASPHPPTPTLLGSSPPQGIWSCCTAYHSHSLGHSRTQYLWRHGYLSTGGWVAASAVIRY